MMLAQYVINGLLIGSLYACLAAGFSLVWGVLNIINMLHGAFVVVGAYIVIFATQYLGGTPLLWSSAACIILFAVGFLIQRGVINKVVAAPIFITFTLTFGMDLVVQDLLINTVTATPRSLPLDYGSVQVAGLIIAVSRLGAMALALALTAFLYWLLKHSEIGRAIIAVRMDRHAASLLGLDVPYVYAVTYGIGAMMAAAAGGAMAMSFPINPVLDGTFLGKAFVICVLGGLGSISGSLIGGLALGLLESFGALAFGSQWSATVGFAAMLAVLALRPAGLAGRSGFE